MSLFKNLRRLFTGAPAPRRRKSAEKSGFANFLESSRLVAGIIFAFTVVSIVLISFVGVSSHTLPVLPNQVASTRIAANEPFSYTSTVRTERLREQISDRVAPIYRIDPEPLARFELHLRAFHNELERIRSLPPAERGAALEKAVASFNARGTHRVSTADAAELLGVETGHALAALFDSGLSTLRAIYQGGIHDGASLSQSRVPDGSVAVFQVLRNDDEVISSRVESLEEALTFLRINLAAEITDRERSLALFRILRGGLIPNLVYDDAATRRSQERTLATLQPVVIKVARGETIIEPDTRVTPEQYEMLVAWRHHLVETGTLARDEGLQLAGRLLLVFAMVIASILYIRLEDAETLRSNGRLALLALVVVINLALVRGAFALGSLPFFLSNTAAASVLPYVAPVIIAPLVVAIMIDAGSGMFMALLIAIFASVIYGNRVDILVLAFVSSMVAVFAAQNTRKRSNVVRAATWAGLTMALAVLLLGLFDRLPWLVIAKQMGASLATGIASGVIVAGLLPVLEALFKRTTDITLLELTDYNHPLLRHMQMEAPGTYHHSLVVAQLAENAASAIGANPLLARVCALFHDIGKTNKPEYFMENQVDGVNPHDDNNPSLSALIIKSHVKDGVDLALKYKLPRAVIDVIQQHHGTTLIRYFFHRAVTKAGTTFTQPPFHLRGSGATPAPFAARGTASPVGPVRPDSRDPFSPGAGPGLQPAPVSETTYRYDGPTPRFKESAIIHLADGIEAASRSLRRVTPQHLGELIEQIVNDRIADGQLDDAPLTFAELTEIKESFSHTLLNMLHGRVAYPKADDTAAAETARDNGKAGRDAAAGDSEDEDGETREAKASPARETPPSATAPAGSGKPQKPPVV
ncbi:phosphohydrolase [Opitutaceae bacterium TAV5]|nr:phosphohydrolase [Opitutaceae bacterium TAV5]